MNPRTLDWRALFVALHTEVAARWEEPDRDPRLWAEAERRIRALGEAMLGGIIELSAEDREDLVQETLLKLQSPAILKRAALAAHAEGYLRAMLRNAGYDLVRRRGSEGRALAQLQYWPTPIFGAETLERREMRERLTREIARLKPEEQELLHLKFWEELTIKEIAKQMSLRYSAVAVRLFRLTRRLADRLQEEPGKEVGERR